ncbi:MAG: divalent-cation tolerance protein CutA [Desulfovibrio sp.]|nr:divalent-cation tolerance protein CutA [Desulfovibrio sp.]
MEQKIGDESREPDAEKVVLVYLTCPDMAGARALARQLVEKRLASGVNILPGAFSVYRWQGAIREREECLLFAQVAGRIFDKFAEFVVSGHPYSTPCVLALPVAGGSPDFLRWVGANSGTD